MGSLLHLCSCCSIEDADPDHSAVVYSHFIGRHVPDSVDVFIYPIFHHTGGLIHRIVVVFHLLFVRTSMV